jgi:hypothetical protein
MDPRAFLALANRLTSETNPEGRRTVIGRAYYAAFNVAAEFLSGIGHKVRADGKGHTQAYYWLNNCKDQLLEQAGGDLHNLLGVRNDADYNLKELSVEKEAVALNWMDVAREIIKTLDECKNGPSKRRQDIAAAVAKYKKDNPS